VFQVISTIYLPYNLRTMRLRSGTRTNDPRTQNMAYKHEEVEEAFRKG